MNAALDEQLPGDDRTTVSLRALLALRERIGRVRLQPLVSRAAHAGQQSSRLYGRGMDYAESRAYQAGDDVRRLDWRLTARSGKLHTKLFQEDREGSVLIVLDTHASMRFGTRTRFKSVQAARAAAAVAWCAVRAGERVGIVGFGPVNRVLRPQGGVRGALAVCGALAQWDGLPAAADDEALSAALLRARRLAHGASRVVLVSDGFSCDAAARAPLHELTQHAAVGVLLVADTLELALPPIGSYPLEYNGQRELAVLRSERQRRDFLRVLGAGATRLRTLASALHLRCAPLETADDACAACVRLLAPKWVAPT
ncbi:MAG TPA: DUF58 domain-containing protein [Rhodanobacter sp.]|nr:DUF58 domain-containing protein [Rhodanobacter sp.]